MEVVIRVEGMGHGHLHEAMLALGRDKANMAWRRAINHTASKSKTQVIRNVAKRAGVTQTLIRNRRAIYLRRANYSNLAAYIIAEGSHMSLKDFNPKQLKAGVRAKPWGTTRLFKSSFIVDKLGSHVFVRTSKKRLPIEKMYGPAIPKEMMEPDVTRAWERLVDSVFPKRVEHELHRITGHIFR